MCEAVIIDLKSVSTLRLDTFLAINSNWQVAGSNLLTIADDLNSTKLMVAILQANVGIFSFLKFVEMKFSVSISQRSLTFTLCIEIIGEGSQ